MSRNASKVVREPVARAIDAGFGVMKFSRAARTEEEKKLGPVVFDSFDSLASATGKTQVTIDGARTRDTVFVKYEGQEYEVGKDIRHAMVAGSDYGRDLTDSYYASDVYHALMRGALAYMAEPEIDTLVLGLPMTHFANKERVEALQKEYTGEVKINDLETVKVNQVVVHPQPFGAFLSLANDIDGINEAIKNYPECGLEEIRDLRDLEKLNILIVDPGEFTLDWLLMTPGGHAEKVSGATGDAGRHRVLRAVHELVQSKLDKPLGASFIKDIDVAIRENKAFRVAGRSFKLNDPEYLAAIEKAVADPVNKLLEGLRGAEDRIDLVVVKGGCPEDVAKAMIKARPYLPVYCPKNGEGHAVTMYANVDGFQEWAEALSHSNLEAEAA